jgi:hypothetical protein
MNSGLTIFSCDSLKFSNFRFLQWCDSPKYSELKLTTNELNVLLGLSKEISTVEFELTTLVVIDTDCTGSWIYNNLHMIMTTTAPIDI